MEGLGNTLMGTAAKSEFRAPLPSSSAAVTTTSDWAEAASEAEGAALGMVMVSTP